MSIEIIKTDVSAKGEKRQKIRQWVLRITIILAILGPLIFMLAGIGAKVGLWDWRFGLGTLTRNVGPKVLMAGGIFALLSMILSFAIAPRKGFFIGAFALIIPLVGLGQLAGVKKKVADLPFIHDITTDTQDVPTFTDAILSERATVEGVNTTDYIGKKDTREEKLFSVLQTKAYPDIRPLNLSGEPSVVFGEAKAAVRQLGWALKSDDVAAGIIEATEVSFWYGFKDDIVIRIRPAEGGGTIIDVRSISRVGRADIGANAARIRKFLGILNE